MTTALYVFAAIGLLSTIVILALLALVVPSLVRDAADMRRKHAEDAEHAAWWAKREEELRELSE